MRLSVVFGTIVAAALSGLLAVSVLSSRQAPCASDGDAATLQGRSLVDLQASQIAALQSRLAGLERAVQQQQIGLKPRDPREVWFEKEVQQWIEYHQMVYNHTLPSRWLYCMDHWGLGNRVQVVVSCVLYAMMTRRALVTKSPVDGLVHPTVKLTHKTIPYEKMVEPDSMKLLCYDWSEDDKHEWIRLRGPKNFDYFGSMLWYNPFHKLIDKLPPNFFQLLFPAVFQLDPVLQVRAAEFKAKHFGKFNIALHIREQIKKFDPNTGRLPVQSVNLTVQTAKTLEALQSVAAAEDVVWFVACENEETILSIQREYGSKKVVYLPFKTGVRDPGDAALAFYLVGECDEIITTDTSTFATNAASRTGKLPVLCSAQGFCTRKLTPQPVEVYASPPVSHCHNLYDSVDNSPGFFYPYYDRMKYRREQIKTLEGAYKNLTSSGNATVESVGVLLEKAVHTIRYFCG